MKKHDGGKIVTRDFNLSLDNYFYVYLVFMLESRCYFYVYFIFSGVHLDR